MEGQAKLDSLKDLIACYNDVTPGATWNAGYYVDAGTGVRNKKMVLVYQDTYMLGKGFMGATSVEVPEKYYSVNK